MLTSRQSYNDAHADYPASETTDGVHIKRCWGLRFGRAGLIGRALDYLSFYASVFWVLLRVSRSGDIVVTTTDPPLLGVIMAPAIGLRGARQVNWLHDLFPEIATRSGVCLFAGAVGKKIRAIRDHNCRRAVANVVLGERMRDYLIDRGVASSKLHVIPNWGPQGLESIARENDTFRHAWGLGNKFVIGYAGNLGRVHEFETLLGAAQVLAQHNRFIFLIVGAGIHLESLRARVAALRLSNVVFQPYQPREYLAASLCTAHLHLVSLKPEFEALVVPSKTYGIAAAGRPALFIGDANGEVACLLKKHGFGYDVRIGDAPGLAQLIQRIADNQNLYTKLCANAALAHHNHFSPSMALSAWACLLKAL